MNFPGANFLATEGVDLKKLDENEPDSVGIAIHVLSIIKEH